jgi:hypothetical protein
VVWDELDYSKNALDLAGPDLVKFGIECKFSSRYTSTDMFKKAVARALRDMKGVFETDMAIENGEVVSRL